MNESQLSGACLCGAVRVTVTSANRNVDACHCGMCRKWTGGPLLAVECGDAVAFEGTENVSVFDSSEWAQRGFCRQCGTHLFYRLKEQEYYALPVGLLDDAGQWHFRQQIFVDEKPGFYAFANETRNLTGAEAFAQFGAAPE